MTRKAAPKLAAKPSHAVAAEFRAELARQRLSQRQFAAKLGVPHGWVARRLTLFEAAITVDDVHWMATVLGRPVEQFLLPRLDSNQQPFGYWVENTPRRVARRTDKTHLRVVR